MTSILHFYGFHISQMSPMGMVRVKHFEFLCRSQGLEPSVEKFRAFYQLIRNMGFYSFGLRAAKKILINPAKSFHDWKMKFFFIREEVIPIAIIFRDSDKIEKEELPIPKTADYYVHLCATPNRIFGEQAAFPAFGGAIGVRPLESGDGQIKANFLYQPARAFANPPTTTEGAQLSKPRPLRGVTSAGKEILYLSSEQSVGLSHEELSSWSNIFAGVLRDLGIDPEEKPKRPRRRRQLQRIR
ncbi:hypothetical protein HanPI659440_Chr09g0343421 [Helianthus annuus]|nr:hypothetical protein HanPI659440_Chr09g0343421 [Helianthus annuus]